MADRVARSLAACVGLTACTLALLAGSAAANTVTFGSSLTAPGFALRPFGPPATVTNSALPAPEVAASPVDGTVVSWSFIGSGGPLTPRVLHPVPNSSYSAAGTGAPQNATSPGVISGPFSVSIPIKKGDLFGVDGASGASLSVAPAAGATNLYFQPALVDGAGGDTPFGTNPGEDAIGATVRYCLVPKMKGLSGNAARQALNAADCTLGQVARGKAKPIKKVLKQGIKAGTSISDVQPVDLTISKRKKH
jgi:PASTA domain-containing protein